jgi:hypothetical protein
LIPRLQGLLLTSLSKNRHGRGCGFVTNQSASIASDTLGLGWREPRTTWLLCEHATRATYVDGESLRIRVRCLVSNRVTAGAAGTGDSSTLVEQRLSIGIFVSDSLSTSRVLANLGAVWQQLVAFRQMPLSLEMRTDPRFVPMAGASHPLRPSTSTWKAVLIFRSPRS